MTTSGTGEQCEGAIYSVKNVQSPSTLQIPAPVTHVPVNHERTLLVRPILCWTYCFFTLGACRQMSSLVFFSFPSGPFEKRTSNTASGKKRPTGTCASASLISSKSNRRRRGLLLPIIAVRWRVRDCGIFQGQHSRWCSGRRRDHSLDCCCHPWRSTTRNLQAPQWRYCLQPFWGKEPRGFSDVLLLIFLNHILW